MEVDFRKAGLSISKSAWELIPIEWLLFQESNVHTCEKENVIYQTMMQLSCSDAHVLIIVTFCSKLSYPALLIHFSYLLAPIQCLHLGRPTPQVAVDHRATQRQTWRTPEYPKPIENPCIHTENMPTRNWTKNPHVVWYVMSSDGANYHTVQP